MSTEAARNTASAGDVYFRFRIWGFDFTIYLESFVVETPVIGGTTSEMTISGAVSIYGQPGQVNESIEGSHPAGVDLLRPCARLRQLEDQQVDDRHQCLPEDLRVLPDRDCRGRPLQSRLPAGDESLDLTVAQWPAFVGEYQGGLPAFEPWT